MPSPAVLQSLPAWVCEGATVSCTGATDIPLEPRVAAIAAVLSALGPRRPVGLMADNSPDWVAVDVAAHLTGVPLVPLPAFFTAMQLGHIVRCTGMQAMFCGEPDVAGALGFVHSRAVTAQLSLYEAPADLLVQPVCLPGAMVQKITFTSGSTGTPKGVCLTAEQQLRTARALADATRSLGIARHLSLLPFAVLLENVAGIYVPLLIGAGCICPSLTYTGLGKVLQFDPEACLNLIAHHEAESVILLPQMLLGLANRLQASPRQDPRLRSLRFVAVGGAKSPPGIIARARELGLPVFEGYGLSECASVVALNVPGADRVGTVGRPLPGAQIRVREDEEIEICGRGFEGYLGAARQDGSEWLRTGDLGHIDETGHLSVHGRVDNLIVTAYGRNVSPEWPESLLLETPGITQAVVFGDGRPHLAAVLVPRGRETADTVLDAAVERANRALPGYARIGAWLRADEPFCARNGLATPNGRVRRNAVWLRYQGALQHLYSKQEQG